MFFNRLQCANRNNLSRTRPITYSRIINQNEKVGEHKKTGLDILQQSGV